MNNINGAAGPRWLMHLQFAVLGRMIIITVTTGQPKNIASLLFGKPFAVVA